MTSEAYPKPWSSFSNRDLSSMLILAEINVLSIQDEFRSDLQEKIDACRAEMVRRGYLEA